MRKLFTVLATASILLAGSLTWKAEAATVIHGESLAPLTKSYAIEKVYWRGYRRRGYYGGYGHPYYGYGYRPYGYGYSYRPYGYYGGWRPGIGIYVGPRWGWGGWGY
jgi:hypothetical protein